MDVDGYTVELVEDEPHGLIVSVEGEQTTFGDVDALNYRLPDGSLNLREFAQDVAIPLYDLESAWIGGLPEEVF